jgi:hypothetical protein
MLIKVHTFNFTDAKMYKQLLKDLRKRHKKCTFADGDIIKPLGHFKVATIQKQHVFSPVFILDSVEKLNKYDQKVAHLVITQSLLADEKSLDTPLYGGLCRPDEHVLIASAARTKDYDVFLTIVNHEIGHLFGLPHCEHPLCIMKEGSHSAVDATDFLCDVCLELLQCST